MVSFLCFLFVLYQGSGSLFLIMPSSNAGVSVAGINEIQLICLRDVCVPGKLNTVPAFLYLGT